MPTDRLTDPSADQSADRPTDPVDLDSLVRDAQAMVRPGRRTLLGLTGSPGAGKSTLADQLAARIEGAVVVGLDAFHLANATLRSQGTLDRKGAPDTFDPAGYVNLLRRLRSDEPVVYAGVFDRGIEETIAGAVRVDDQVRLVITEGNYLLLDGPDWPEWAPIAGLLDTCWFLDLAEDTRWERLAGRHVEHGRSPDEARQRAREQDQANAVLIEAGRERADRVVVLG